MIWVQTVRETEVEQGKLQRGKRGRVRSDSVARGLSSETGHGAKCRWSDDLVSHGWRVRDTRTVPVRRVLKQLAGARHRERQARYANKLQTDQTRRYATLHRIFRPQVHRVRFNQLKSDNKPHTGPVHVAQLFSSEVIRRVWPNFQSAQDVNIFTLSCSKHVLVLDIS